MLYGAKRPLVQDLVAVLFRRKFIIAIAIIVATSVAALTSSFRPVTYQAEATLILKFGREYIYRPEVGDTSNRFVPFNVEEAINGEVQILNSRDLKNLVIEEVGLGKLAPWAWTRSLPARVIDAGIGIDSAFEALKLGIINKVLRRGRYNLTEDKFSPESRAVSALQNGIAIRTNAKSPTIRITYRHWDKETAVEVLESLIDGFLKKRLAVLGGGPLPFLDKQVDELRSALAANDRELNNFKTRNNILDLAQEMSSLLQQKAVLEGELRTATRELEVLRQQLAKIEDDPAPVAAQLAVFSEQEAAQVRLASQELLRLRLEEQRLLATYTEAARPVVSAQEEIARVNEYLEEQKVAGMNRVRQRLDATATRVDLLTSQAETATSELARLDALRPELRELERRARQVESDFQSYSAKVDAERLARALDEERVSNVRVVQEPVFSPRPLGLPKQAKMVLGASIGLLVGILIGFLAELRRNTLVTKDNVVEKLELPVLAAVPRITYKPS